MTTIQLAVPKVQVTPRSVAVVDGVAVVTLNVPVPIPTIPKISIKWPPTIPAIITPLLPQALATIAQYLQDTLAILTKLVNMIPFIDVRFIVKVNGVVVLDETILGLVQCLPTVKS